MPRVARIKNESGIYHVMVRGISEISLFKDHEDKCKYFSLIKKYQQIFLFQVYAYCLMTTHGHIALNCCGADISKIMKSINQCYASYFNRKYNRHGHVFQDRFKSKSIENDKYLITLSAYIHNNPKDIDSYKNCLEKYQYSSLGVYLGITKDSYSILNTDYILLHFSNNKKSARKNYLDLINRSSDSLEKIEIEFENEGYESRNERKILIRDFTPEVISSYVSRYEDNLCSNLHIKFNHKSTEFRALCVILMRSLCNLSFKDIGSIMGNITISNLYQLHEKGYNLITKNDKYVNIIDDFIIEFSHK
jgi:putative transposase